MKARKNFSIIAAWSAFSLYQRNLLHNLRLLHQSNLSA
jgi:hypothetical protein